MEVYEERPKRRSNKKEKVIQYNFLPILTDGSKKDRAEDEQYQFLLELCQSKNVYKSLSKFDELPKKGTPQKQYFYPTQHITPLPLNVINKGDKKKKSKKKTKKKGKKKTKRKTKRTQQAGIILM